MLQWRLPKIPTAPFCPSEVQASVAVPSTGSAWRKFLAFVGPGLLVSVGYMDPGNWATDIAGGSQFGYALLSVIFISNLMAIVLQALCVRLGLATRLDLAQACGRYYNRRLNFALWIFAEIAIIACDLAEILGSAIALNLLFQLPLAWGVCITGIDLLFVLLLQGKGFRWLEALIGGLVLTIALCFAIEIVLARPNWGQVLQGYVPTPAIVTNREMLYLAISIIGATVMPHNLYLHSAIVKTRKYDPAETSTAEVIRYATLDSTIALFAALLVNSAILIVAATAFHFSGNQSVAEIQDAYKLLSPLLGTTAASFIFAIALLASGQSSTVTGTIAGQVVMEGFLALRIPCWMRRVITRGLAIVPALVGLAILGEAGVGRLLIFSQVVLSLQLPFAIFPLILFTGNARIMEQFVSPRWLKLLAWGIAVLIAGLNVWLLGEVLRSA